MTARFDVVIVGAGQAGGALAITLRTHKFAGSIALVGDEQEPPYERPSLSKEYFAGEKTFERLHLRPPAFWSERAIELCLGQRVTRVDADAHVVHLSNGEAIDYGTLVWATGGAPRKLTCTGHHLRGVHAVRTRADVDQMRRELATTRAVAIIGGGYIGLEAASVLRKMDKAVTVLEAQDRVLARVAGEPLSRWFEAEHRAHGVDVRLGTTVVCIEEKDGAAAGVRLSTGEMVPADMVIVGIGIVPAVEPLLAAGANGGENAGGVLVDLYGKTNLPDVYAIGDCAAHANVHANGATLRLESVQNANDQAALVAKSILGQAERYDAVPWFWSHQYDLRLQTVGLSIDHDETVIRGDMTHVTGRAFSVVYLRQGKVIALDCVNAAKDYMQGKALVLANREFDRAKLADPQIPLKSLLT